MRSIQGSASAAITPAARNESWKLESASDDGFQIRSASAASATVFSSSTRRKSGRAQQIERGHQRGAQNRRAILHDADVGRQRDQRDQARER